NPYEFEAEPLIMAAPTDSSIDMRYQKRDELTKEKVIEAELALMSGYRQDELSWNIAGNIAGEDPNILVQYDWTGLHIYQIKGKGRVIFNEAFVIDGEAARGEALAGDVRVSEYDADNKRSEATRVTADAEGSSTMDFSLGFGYQFKLNKLSKIDDAVEFDEETNLTLLAGYSYHEQDLNIREGVQVLDTGSPPSLGPFPGLDSPYKTEWQGPWIGVEVNGEREKIDGRIRFEYHFPEYYAEGRSNLQPAFQQPKSFEHEADGTGMVLAANFDYNINEDWKIDLAADAQMWNATEGVDRLFLLNGQQPETRLNDVDWESFSVMLGATYKFE
ncbi:MAG: hypothetical protein KC618_07205, partial [Candidatus Omnitrophica bacterium]|nr:hypothetical protein [Candidatus Omnitrophota bacterium]